MNGWLYLIKNGDLYKIGITSDFERRMRQLKPDCIVAKLYSNEFKKLERELHKKYKNVRIPQTEYFRLEHKQIKQIKKRLNKFYYPMSVTLDVFIKSISMLLVLFVIVLFIISLNINDIKNVIKSSVLLMERISFGLTFISLFIKSNKFLSFVNELKFRSSRFLILAIFSFCFRLVSVIFYR